MFGLFSSERESGTHSISRDEASDAEAGTCSYRHRWTLSNFSRGVTARRNVRRQRFASPVAARRARKERGRHFVCRETLRGRYESPTRVPHRQRQRVLKQYVRGLLQWSWNSSRVYGTIYATAEWIRVASALSRAFKAGHAACPGAPQLYLDIRLEEIRDFTDAAGTSLWQEGGNTSERRGAFPS